MVVGVMRKNKKRIVWVFLAGAALLSFCFGFGLVKQKDGCGDGYRLPDRIQTRIKEECKGKTPKQCARYGIKLTCELLRFAKTNDIAKGRANCIGYSILCSEICNYAFLQNGLSCRAKPVRGYVTFCGVNLCPLLQAVAPQKYKGFVKDHDFVELNFEKEIMYCDASLYEYWIDCTTSVGNQQR